MNIKPPAPLPRSATQPQPPTGRALVIPAAIGTATELRLPA